MNTHSAHYWTCPSRTPFTTAATPDLRHSPCWCWWRLQPVAAPDFPARSWNRFPFDHVPAFADDPSSQQLNPVSFDHVPAYAVDIPATIVYQITNYQLPPAINDKLLRLHLTRSTRLHHRLSTSHSDPQHGSDATSAILHWIHLSWMIRLIKACYF